MRKIIIIILFFLVVAVGWTFYTKPKTLQTFVSPNGEYTLLIVNRKGLIHTLKGVDRFIDVKVVDKNGKMIGKTNSKTCNMYFEDIEIEWGLESVWFTRAGRVNLITGEASC